MWLQAMRAKFNGEGPLYGKQEWDKLLGHCQVGSCFEIRTMSVTRYEQILRENFQAVCDVPAVCFAKELMQAYPEAKVILTNRDIESWHEYGTLAPFHFIKKTC
jgi:hypothetical protein